MPDAKIPHIPRLTYRELKAVFRRAKHKKWTQLYVIGPALGWSAEEFIDRWLEWRGDAIPVDRMFRVVNDKPPELPDRTLLNQLRVLSWIGCDLTPDAAKSLARLTKLISLDLGNNQIGPGGAESLAGLTSLTSLDLAHNHIYDGGVESLAELRNLTSLDLRENRIGDSGAKSLARLTNLRLLDLAHNQIYDGGVESLAELRNLTSLDLRENRIGDGGARSLAGLTNLASLALGSNWIGPAGAKSLAGLTNLTLLDLRKNEIGDNGFRSLVEAWRDGKLQKLERLDVRGNGITAVDPAVLETCDAKRILHTDSKGLTLLHARVMLVGMGGVGKSFLAQRTFQQDKPLDEADHVPTHDILIVRPDECTAWKPVIMTPSGDITVEPWVWDFAGQLVTHGVHEAFLEDDGRTVYVLTLAADRVPNQKTKDDYGNRLVYWLQMLQHYVGRNAPVLIVITRCDVCPKGHGLRPIDTPIEWPRLSELCPLNQLEPDYFLQELCVWLVGIVDGYSSCAPDYDIKGEHGLRSVLSATINKLGVLKDGKVPRELPELKQRVEARLAPCTMVSLDEFHSWCAEANVHEASLRDDLLRMLHHMGSLVYWGETHTERQRRATEPDRRYEDVTRRRRTVRWGATSGLQSHILNPRWFKHCVYAITRTSEERSAAGWLTEFKVDDIVQEATTESGNWFKPTAEDGSVIREGMEFTGICFKDVEQRAYLFPRGLTDLAVTPFADWDTTVIEWDFLPEHVVARLLVQFHIENLVFSEQKGKFIHGRNGALIEYPAGSGAHAVVLADSDQARIEVRYSPKFPQEKQQGLLDHLLTLLQRKDLQGRTPINRPKVPSMAVVANSATPLAYVQPELKPWEVIARKIEDKLTSDNQREFWCALWEKWKTAHPDGPRERTSEDAWVPFRDLLQDPNVENQTIYDIKGQLHPIILKCGFDIESAGKGRKPGHYRLVIKPEKSSQ